MEKATKKTSGKASPKSQLPMASKPASSILSLKKIKDPAVVELVLKCQSHPGLASSLLGQDVPDEIQRGALPGAVQHQPEKMPLHLLILFMFVTFSYSVFLAMFLLELFKTSVFRFSPPRPWRIC